MLRELPASCFLIDTITSSQRHFTDSVIQAAPSYFARNEASAQISAAKSTSNAKPLTQCRTQVVSRHQNWIFNFFFASSLFCSNSATDPIKFWFRINQTIITGLAVVQANAPFIRLIAKGWHFTVLSTFSVHNRILITVYTEKPSTASFGFLFTVALARTSTFIRPTSIAFWT